MKTLPHNLKLNTISKRTQIISVSIKDLIDNLRLRSDAVEINACLKVLAGANLIFDGDFIPNPYEIQSLLDDIFETVPLAPIRLVSTDGSSNFRALDYENQKKLETLFDVLVLNNEIVELCNATNLIRRFRETNVYFHLISNY